MTEIKDLSHTEYRISPETRIVVLNTGALIDPESEAMLQALYSRSPESVQTHLDIIAEKGPEHFMSTYYVGYGHKSIGDCGSATVFIEGVSMLAAKAVQDWALYSGQEVSTRYVDFTTQPFVDPIKTDASANVLAEWRKFYTKSFAPLVSDLKERHPMQADDKERSYEKAINARAFDILRGFLPAGAMTNLAWHGNLRQFADKLQYLSCHPLTEVQDIADAIENALIETFPGSFAKKRYYEESHQYREWWMRLHYYYDGTGPESMEIAFNGVDDKLLYDEYGSVLAYRPPKTDLPHQINECGTLRFEGLLDFGSFRDLQRHRAVTLRMPLLRIGKHAFERWYTEELPFYIRQSALSLLEAQAQKILSLPCDDFTRQYYAPMGYKVPIRLSGGLASLVYLVELRANRFVHATLRKQAQIMATQLTKEFVSCGLVLHIDKEPDRFDVRRGEQDIVKQDA